MLYGYVLFAGHLRAPPFQSLLESLRSLWSSDHLPRARETKMASSHVWSLELGAHGVRAMYTIDRPSPLHEASHGFKMLKTLAATYFQFHTIHTASLLPCESKTVTWTSQSPQMGNETLFIIIRTAKSHWRPERRHSLWLTQDSTGSPIRSANTGPPANPSTAQWVGADCHAEGDECLHLLTKGRKCRNTVKAKER